WLRARRSTCTSRGVAPRLLALGWSLGASLSFLVVTAAQAQSPATEIHETVPLGPAACTIKIAGGDLLMCAGQQVTVTAQLECGSGFMRVQDPQWFLGAEFLGTGDAVALSPPPGTYVLTVTCASCQDQISLTVQGQDSCYWTPH